jgi:TonB family protein
MKTKLILVLCMIISIITFGQEKKENAGKLNEVSISPAIFSQRSRAMPALSEEKSESLENYLSRNVIYPEQAVNAFKQGTVMVKFVVSPKGEISDFKVTNSVSAEIDDEVIRVLLTTAGMWIPGYFNGEPVAEEKEVSVVFKLSELGKFYDFAYLGQKYFSKGSEIFFIKNNAQKALKFYDQGITLLPRDQGLLLMRGMARYESGDTKGACQDWTRLKELGGMTSNIYLNNLCGYKGYAELVSLLEK